VAKVSKYFILTKMSSPGWEFGSEHLRIVLNMAEDVCCDECKAEVKYNSKKDKTTEEKLNALLESSCGAEYLFEEFKDYDEYCKKLGENHGV
jgi:hypothetical protein